MTKYDLLRTGEWFCCTFEPTSTWHNLTFAELFMQIGEHNAQIRLSRDEMRVILWNQIPTLPNFTLSHWELWQIFTRWIPGCQKIDMLKFKQTSTLPIFLTFGQLLVWIGICNDQIWHREKTCFEQCSNLFEIYLITLLVNM